jgi:hypothetical protein
MSTTLPDPGVASATSEAGCPSDRVLDLLLASALDDASTSALREHLAGCRACSTRFAELGAFRDEVAATLPRFSELVAKAPRPLHGSRSRRGWLGGALAAAAAVVAVWIVRAPSESPLTEQTRAKGSAQLGFYVQRGAQVFRGGPGELLRPGDAIEFSYEAPSDGYLGVLSRDGAGQASIYFPTGSRAQALSPGPQLLAQSTTLDAVLGPELLYAFWCEAPVELEPIRRALDSSPTPPRIPGCSVESLEVEKGLP